MHIALGSDHRGVQLKSKLCDLLTSDGLTVHDFGTNSDQSVDYPDFAKAVAESIANGTCERGILICGTGIGMAITANKFPGVRAAVCADEVLSEICRRHNDVNVICLPADLIGDRPIGDMIRIWLATEFDGGRHTKRITKIAQIEGREPKAGE
jgi:ribose 5-phosphate isomerase B